jgi:hypothetical protein
VQRSIEQENFKELVKGLKVQDYGGKRESDWSPPIKCTDLNKNKYYFKQDFGFDDLKDHR